MEGKTQRITVRLTPSEEDWIIQAAQQNSVSKSRYMRNVVLGELPQAEHPYATNQQALKFSDKITKGEFITVMYDQIPRAGNNLNQIARRLNDGAPADQKMVDMMASIEDSFTKIADKVLEVEG